MTVESVIRAWYEAYCVKNKKGSEQILRSFELHLFSKIGNIPHDAATLHDWLEVLEPLSTKTPAIADRLLINAKRESSLKLARCRISRVKIWISVKVRRNGF